MKHLGQLLNPFLLTMGLLTFTSSCSQTAKSDQKELGTYVGATPCISGSQPLPGIPSDSDCEFIKWQLTLFVNEKNEPLKYKLEYNYGIGQPNTQGFQGGGKKGTAEGKWQITKGSKTNPSATVVELELGKPSTIISLIKLSDGILHLLDNEKRLMVGNPGWSFTLNKVSK